MDKADIKKAIEEYVNAANLAVNEAGFGEGGKLNQARSKESTVFTLADVKSDKELLSFGNFLNRFDATSFGRRS